MIIVIVIIIIIIIVIIVIIVIVIIEIVIIVIAPMKWTVFPGPWRVDGKGITYIRCTNYSFL